MTFKIKPKGIGSLKPIVKEDELICGIYMIQNTVNNKRYVGSSKDIRRRFQTHKKDLRKGAHQVRRMQKDFDEIGEEKFKFTILEKDIDEQMLTAYEKWHMYNNDSIVMYKGYNSNFPTLNHKNFQEVCKIKKQLGEKSDEHK